MSSAICTLFEGDYHHGVGALINSLRRYGYDGAIEIGYRGKLPVWMQNSDEILKGTSITLNLHELKTRWHLTNYKAQFLMDLFSENPKVDRLFYFDPDIVIKCPWGFFEEWVEPGVAIVEEIATRGMAYNHPLRRKWVAIAASLDITIKPSFSQYFSAGFVGVRRSMIPYLEIWLRAIKHLPALGHELSQFMPKDPLHPLRGDQDALNIMAMAAEPHLSTIGPEGMDFIPGGHTMSHAVGGVKPWRKNYLLSALKGIKPTMADREFWNNAAAPIPVFPDLVVRRRQAGMKLAVLIGRFYHR